MRLILNYLGKFIDAIGYVCSMLMILMVLNVFYDVVMRYFFNDVSIAMQEMEWHLFAAMFMFGIGYTLKEDGHVRVDVFYEGMSSRTKSYINIFGGLVFVLPITLLILYFGWDYTHEAYEMGEGSADPGGLPHRFIVRGIIPASSIFLILCVLYVVLQHMQNLRTPDTNIQPDPEYKDKAL